MTRESKPSIGQRIIDRLSSLVEALERGEALAERFTCREVELDLEPTPHDAELVRRTRDALRASQAVFARFLGVSAQTVRAWEQGANRPTDIACRFMDEIRRDPAHWRRRLEQAAVRKPAAKAKRRPAPKR